MFTDEDWALKAKAIALQQKQALENGEASEWEDPTGRKFVVHAPEKCAGQRCVFHNPSEHTMRKWPILARETGLIERKCPHGIGHPDPDSLDYFTRTFGEGWGVHGCDGCEYSSHSC